MENPEIQTRSITIVLHSNRDFVPVAHFYGETNYVRVQFVEYIPHFWCFQLEDILPEDNSFQICFSPSLGPSELLDLDFAAHQPFVFKDLTKAESLIPFEEFNEFFSKSISSGFLSFSWSTEDPITSIRNFIYSFDDDCFIWALAFVSMQPWRALFIYNEDFSKLLLEILTPFIERNFYIEDIEMSVPFDQFSYFVTPADMHEKAQTPLHPKRKYNSIGKYADVLMYMIQVQLGDLFAYMISTIIDFTQEFPFTAYLPPFYSSHKLCVAECEGIITRLFNYFLELNDDQKTIAMTRLLYTVIAIYNEQMTMDIKPFSDFVALDYTLFDKIIKSRMYASSNVCPEALENLVKRCPLQTPEKDVVDIASSDSIVPVEWLSCFFDIFEVPEKRRNEIAEQSFANSVPSHITEHFFLVTESGALVMGHAPYTILQPGVIVQPTAKLQENSMLMTGAIAMDGSTLSENAYVPPGAIVTPQDRPIHPSAHIDVLNRIDRGISIHSDAVICANVTLSDGCVIYDSAVIGENATIGIGAVIEPGEVVATNYTVPMGFSFSEALVEDCQKLPDVVKLRGSKFTKQHSSAGVKDIKSMKGVDISAILRGYLHLMTDFPCEFGRQLHELPVALTGNEIYENFGIRTLHVAMSFWDTLKEESGWTPVIKDAVTAAAANFEVEFEDFELPRTGPFILKIVERIDDFVKHGIKEQIVKDMRQTIYDTCAELKVRLNLVSEDNDSKIIQICEKIVVLAKI